MDQDEWERAAITSRFRNQSSGNKVAVLITFLIALNIRNVHATDVKWTDVYDYCRRLGKN